MSERRPLSPNKLTASLVAALAIAAGVASTARSEADHSQSPEIHHPVPPEFKRAKRVFESIREVANVVIIIPVFQKGKKHNDYFYDAPEDNAPRYVDGGGFIDDSDPGPKVYKVGFPFHKRIGGEDWLAVDVNKTQERGAMSMTGFTPQSMSQIEWLKASDLPKGTKVYQLRDTPAGKKPILKGEVEKITGIAHFKGIPDNFYGEVQVVPADYMDQLPSVATEIPNLEKFLHSN